MTDNDQQHPGADKPTPAPSEDPAASAHDETDPARSTVEPEVTTADETVDEPVEVPDELLADLKATLNAAGQKAARAQVSGAPYYPTGYLTEADYLGGNNDGDSAAKLADSAVAPLIVAARGYETVHEEDLVQASTRFGLPRGNNQQARRIKEAVTRGDLMIMPWYTVDDIDLADRANREAKPTSIQFRPTRPEVDEKGRERKYELVGGQKTPIGCHPAFTREWIDQAPVIILAEGLLKGDSAFTAYLISQGVKREDLAWNASQGGPEQARVRLRQILEQIDPKERILFLTIVGVQNWNSNREWRSIELRDREVWIGFDGDVATNVNVFRAASQLWEFLADRKHVKPALIAPVHKGEDGEKKVGMDDFLSKYGNWHDLVAQRADRLPPTPKTDDAENVGKYRISPDGTALQVCKAKRDPFTDEIQGGHWVDDLSTSKDGVPFHLPIGGRILKTISSRTPTTKEVETGVLGAGAHDDDADAFCEVEISWKRTDGSIAQHVVKGPSVILNYTPDQWARHGAHLPNPVVANENWPPPKKIGEEWLRAMKANRSDEILHRVSWDAMGWVPADGAVPAFIIGESVIGDEEDGADIMAGVDERALAGAGRFGVGETRIGDFETDAAYRDEVKAAIEETIEVLIKGGAWTDRRVASTTVAEALRPCVPIRPSHSVYIVGPPGRGKALPLDARIPVPVSARFPTGWARNRELSPGDEVFAPDGATTRIRSVSPVVDDLSMVSFELSDGQVVTSTTSHMWKISTKQSRSDYQRNRNALVRADRKAKADAVRVLANAVSNCEGVTLAHMARRFGIPQARLHWVVKQCGIPADRVYLVEEGSGQKARRYLATEAFDRLKGRHIAGMTVGNIKAQADEWLTLVEIGERITGVRHLASELTGLYAALARTEPVVSSKIVTEPKVRPMDLYPVGETLVALAEQIEHGNGDYMPRNRIMTAAEIASMPLSHAPAIDPVVPIHGPVVDLPIPPYTLGAWLGDGTLNSGEFTCYDLEILDRIRLDGFEITARKADGVFSIVGLSSALNALGVRETKHIPPVYLRASVDQRLALLQGLMDTDGTISEAGQSEFCVTDERLATSVLELVRSLGVHASLRPDPALTAQTDTTTGEKKTRRVTGIRYRVAFTTSTPVFALSRKAARVKDQMRKTQDLLYIRDVTTSEPVPSRCIQVEHHSGTFLTDDFVTTHNSWTAERMMGFWSATPGAFTGELPGSAKDTAAAMEITLSRAPIWVIDDLAPASSRAQSEREQDTIQNVIRSVFNGSPKRRSDANMGTRRVHVPRALLVVTAENELQVASARERTIALQMGFGALPQSPLPVQRAVALTDVSGAPSLVTQALIRFMRWEAKRNPEGWAGYHQLVKDMYEQSQSNAATRMRQLSNAAGGPMTRQSNIAGDIAVSLLLLRRLAEQVGVRKDILDLISYQGMVRDVYDLVYDGHGRNKESTPGRSLMEAVKAALFTKKAHILDVVDSSAPPFGNQTAPVLGWEIGAEGVARPKGDSIGWAYTEKDGRQVILLDRDNAFRIAAVNYPNLIPSGQTARSSWQSVQGENLAIADLLRERNGSKLATGRKTIGTLTLTGVPILLETLLAGGAPADPADIDESSIGA